MAACSLVIGEPFDPRPSVCGFHAVDFTDSSPLLSDAQKRVFDRLYRFAARTGECYASARHLGGILGRPERSVERDLAFLKRIGLLRSERHGRKAAGWLFLFHPMFQAASKPPSMAVQGKSPNRQIGLSKPPKSRSKPPRVADKSDIPSIPKESKANPNGDSGASSSSENEKVLKPEQTFKTLSQNADDDEKPERQRAEPDRMLNRAEHLRATKTVQPVYATPRDEVIAVVRDKYAVPVTDQTLSDIASALENRYPPTNWTEFLEAARPHLERGQLRNPAGFLLSLARQFRQRTEGSEPRLAPPPPPEKCPLCHEPKGGGLKVEGNRIVFCECATPEFREKMIARGWVKEADGARL